MKVSGAILHQRKVVIYLVERFTDFFAGKKCLKRDEFSLIVALTYALSVFASVWLAKTGLTNYIYSGHKVAAIVVWAIAIAIALYSARYGASSRRVIVALVFVLPFNAILAAWAMMWSPVVGNIIIRASESVAWGYVLLGAILKIFKVEKDKIPVIAGICAIGAQLLFGNALSWLQPSFAGKLFKLLPAWPVDFIVAAVFTYVLGKNIAKHRRYPANLGGLADSVGDMVGPLQNLSDHFNN